MTEREELFPNSLANVLAQLSVGLEAALVIELVDRRIVGKLRVLAAVTQQLGILVAGPEWI